MADMMGVTVRGLQSWKLQRNYLWEVRLPTIRWISGMEVAKYCQKVTFGDYSMDTPQAIRSGALQSKYANFLTIPTVTLTFVKPIPDVVSRYMFQWKDLIVDTAGYFEVRESYAKTVYVKMFDVDGSESMTYTLERCFPVKFPSYTLDYESDRLTFVEVTLSVDRIRVETV